MTTSPVSPHSAPRPHWSVLLFHWTMAALILATFIIGQVMEDMPRAERLPVMGWHVLAGLAVLALFLPRILAVKRDKSGTRTRPSGWTGKIAALMHGLLYLAMLILPLSGLMAVMTSGRNFPVIGLFSLPTFGDIEWLHDLAEDIHETLIPVLVVLVILHVVAALWHHFVVRDEVLARYLPGRKKR
ncbi:MAG: cytochrome b [Pseudomonadota bacterium]